MKKKEIVYLKINEKAHGMIYHQSNISSQRSLEEKEKIRQTVNKEIWIRVYISNIKRDPKCDTQATLEEKLTFFERVRITGKELC